MGRAGAATLGAVAQSIALLAGVEDDATARNDWGDGTRNACADRRLANDEDLADVVAGEKEFDARKLTEEVLDVAIVEDALQAELRSALEFERVRAGEMIAVVGRVWTRVASVEEREQHAAGAHRCGEFVDER